MRVTVLTADKINFKMKTITRNKEGQYSMIMGLIHKQDIAIINIYAPNIGTTPIHKANVNNHKSGN